jgi:hypothetical protein
VHDPGQLVGIVVLVGGGDAVVGNRLHDNAGLGIDLYPDLGVNANNAGAADRGTNNLQNLPVFSSAVSDGTATTLTGTLNSNPNTTFRVEYVANTSCDPSENEGISPISRYVASPCSAIIPNVTKYPVGSIHV